MLLPNVASAQIMKTTFIGISGNTTIIGDWNGDGKTEIGITNGLNWYLDYNGNGSWDAGTDKLYMFGATGWTPVAGDWNGDDHTEIGVFQDGVWYLDYNGNGVWNAGIDKVYYFGAKGWTPVVEDWNGDGKTEVGVFQNGVWYLDYNGNGAWNAGTDKQYTFGAAGWTPVAGDWNKDSKTEVGAYRNGVYQLDYNGNGVWNGATVDKQVNFGITGYTPKAGDWNGDGKTNVGITNGFSWYLDNENAAIASTPSITVTSPVGGESWVSGSTHTITWSSFGDVGSNVKIEVLKAGAVVQTITSSTPNDGSYNAGWTISPSLTTGTDYRIRITSTTNPAITDTSNNYLTLIPASGTITVTGGTPQDGVYIASYAFKYDGSDEVALLKTAIAAANAHTTKTLIFPAGKTISVGTAGVSDPLIELPRGVTLIGN